MGMRCICVCGAPLYALQNLPGHIRAALTCTKAWDIDFKNSQPTILLHLAERMEAEGKPVMCTALRRYVKHRDAVLRQVGGDMTKAKKKVLAIINGSDRVDATACHGGGGLARPLSHDHSYGSSVSSNKCCFLQSKIIVKDNAK